MEILKKIKNKIIGGGSVGTNKREKVSNRGEEIGEWRVEREETNSLDAKCHQAVETCTVPNTDIIIS